MINYVRTLIEPNSHSKHILWAQNEPGQSFSHGSVKRTKPIKHKLHTKTLIAIHWLLMLPNSKLEQLGSRPAWLNRFCRTWWHFQCAWGSVAAVLSKAIMCEASWHWPNVVKKDDLVGASYVQTLAWAGTRTCQVRGANLSLFSSVCNSARDNRHLHPDPCPNRHLQVLSINAAWGKDWVLLAFLHDGRLIHSTSYFH